MILMNSTATPRKAGKVNTKLGFSVERPRRSGSETGNVNPEDDILNQSTYTPIKADQSSFAGYRTQRSIFMENQLDLNESEMEYYENIVNDLAEKLERMQEEKEDLQSISNSLGDRLQRLSQQKEEALLAAKDVEERRLAMEARVADLEASLTAKIQVHYSRHRNCRYCVLYCDGCIVVREKECGVCVMYCIYSLTPSTGIYVCMYVCIAFAGPGQGGDAVCRAGEQSVHPARQDQGRR